MLFGCVVFLFLLDCGSFRNSSAWSNFLVITVSRIDSSYDTGIIIIFTPYQLFSGVWVTANFLRSTGLFSIFCSLDDLNYFSDLQFLRSFLLSEPTTIGITVTLMFHSFFLVLKQGPSIRLSFRFPLFSVLYGSTER